MWWWGIKGNEVKKMRGGSMGRVCKVVLHYGSGSGH